MALIIQSTSNNKICIQGTSVDLDQVYARLDLHCLPNGRTVEISYDTYLDSADYRAGKLLLTDLPQASIIQDVDPQTAQQGLQSAHEIARAWFESYGYVVSIDLV